MEHQQTEWKESWRDEYLKWICGFANAQGGILHIGRNDKGVVVGLTNPKKLLEDIPNKIDHHLGIVADIDLLEENGLPYICITVPTYPNAISYQGKHYYRTGGTLQTLTGNALDDFILRKQGRTWDSVPVPGVSVGDLYQAAFQEFRQKAIESERLTPADLNISDEVLLKNLYLTAKGELQRAAVLLFYRDPEQFIPGAYVKIGFFANDADLLFQDEIHGPLIFMPDKVMETIYLKYFKGMISYRGIQRVESYPVPREAMREAILNAIVHRLYNSPIPIQIRVYSDKVVISNDGRLPEDWTIADLLSAHRSEPHNPSIATTFFRSGMIESWGRGIDKITKACEAAGKLEPSFEIKHGREFIVTFYTDTSVGDDVGESVGVNNTRQTILNLMQQTPTITAQQLADMVGISKRRIESNISYLKQEGMIERVGSAKSGHWIVKQMN